MAHLEMKMFNPTEIAAAITAPKPETVAWIFQSHENRINIAKREAAGFRGPWSMPNPISIPEPMTDERAKVEALDLDRHKAVCAASPRRAIIQAVAAMEDEGEFAAAAKVQAAVSRGTDFRTQLISANECGWIIKALADSKSDHAAAILLAVGENLRAL